MENSQKYEIYFKFLPALYSSRIHTETGLFKRMEVSFLSYILWPEDI
jgi:hypothetical protein